MTAIVTTTGADVLTVAALMLEGSDRKPWAVEHLTVAAWRIAPAVFGLVGYRAAYPDHKRVSVEVYKKTATFRRRIEPVPGGRVTLYRLTDAGRERAEVIAPRLAAATGGAA